MTFRVGLIINPFAGIGGAVGLKGSDGDEIRQTAFARGAELRACQRMERCLLKLHPHQNELKIFCFSGDMGEKTADAAGLCYEIVGSPEQSLSTAQDTTRAVAALVEKHIDILLFAGGDGTARNIADALIACGAPSQVVLGVPSGVKMHSGVYAITPEAAADIVIGLIKKQIIGIDLCDIKDIDEEAFREGKVKTRWYASLYAPVAPQYLQQVKNSGAAQDELIKLDIANYLIDQLDETVLYIVGPGSTTFVFLEQLGLDGTLLGVDIVLNKQLVAKDATANEIYLWLTQHKGAVMLVITAIGGQGHILGRGNQQLEPRIIEKIPRHAIRIIATKEKIHSLQGRPLLVDSNDSKIDNAFSGYHPVLVGYNEFIFYPIGNYFSAQ